MVDTEHDNGLVQIASHHSVVETLARLERLLVARGLTVFARIDFSGDAARAGLTMRAEQMLIFGNPRAGTPLMQSVPACGIDLPLKALAWEDAAGRTWLAYNAPAYILQRHGLPAAMAGALTAPIGLLEAAAQAVNV